MSSDEDDIDEVGQEYLERLQEHSTKSKKVVNSGFNVVASIEVSYNVKQLSKVIVDSLLI